MGNPRTPQPIRGGFAVILLDTHVIFELTRPHPEPLISGDRILALDQELSPKSPSTLLFKNRLDFSRYCANRYQRGSDLYLSSNLVTTHDWDLSRCLGV